MNKVVSSLFLSIRPINLIIIGLTMFVTRYGIINSLIQPWEFELQTELFHFILLVLSTLLVAAGGNVINDYFDTKIDSINHPKSMNIGAGMKPVHAIVAHGVFSFLGVCLGTYVAYTSGNWVLALFPVGATYMLWRYSAKTKRTFLSGNIVVALLAGAVIVETGLFEIFPLRYFYLPDLYRILEGNQMGWEPEDFFKILWTWIGAFAFFAFWYNLIREILKDWQDIKGDKAVNSQTIPLVLGITWTQRIISILLLLGVVFLGGVWFYFLHDDLTLAYFGLMAALSLWVILDISKSIANLKRSSIVLKAIMVLGILYALLIHLTL